MKLKKANAVLGLLSVPFLLLHMGYLIYAYLSLDFSQDLKAWTAVPFMVLVCFHAVCGMLTVFIRKDSARPDLYPGLNRRTILQRVSAALMLPTLILHINTFSLMQSASAGGQWFFFALLLLSQPLFYAMVLSHAAVSFSRGLITLGWLSSPKAQKTVDLISYFLFGALFLLACYATIRTELAMFLPGGGHP